MPVIPEALSEALSTFKMLFGSLYQRLLVTAGAVAFLVVNWFCKPARRREPHEPQDQALETAPEREALLKAKDDELKDEINGSAEDVALDAAAYKERELSQPDADRQLLSDTEVAPEDVTVEPEQVPSPQQHHPFERRMRAAGWQPGPASPSTSAAAASAGAAQPAPGGESAVTAPVDEDYLKSFLDRELGPPKFAVRKQTPERQPEPPASDRSLQELLDQAFGPPKFSVPKAASPARNSIEAPGAAVTAPLSSASPVLKSSPAPSGSAIAASDAAGVMGSGSPGAATGVKRSALELESDAVPEEASGLGPQSFAVLTLVVIEGPAAGKRAVADDPAVEYKIGRLPDSWLQVLDGEVSGRHASVRWEDATRRWMLHDVGSLNGTSLGGEAIGREYKVPGDERPLANGDEVLLGSFTKMRVELAARGAAQSEARGVATAATTAAGAEAAAGAVSAKRHHSNSFDFGMEVSGGITDRSHLDTVAGLKGLQGLPSPGALLDYPQLGARLCVHSRLGADHKRMSQGCEDVPHWELPFEPYAGAGIVCVFDGHHGSKAAKQAKEHLPAILRAKLLRRDGRQPPELPPPTPPPPRRQPSDEEEEEMIEAYDGASSEEIVEEEPDEQAGGLDGSVAADDKALANATEAKSSPGHGGGPESSSGGSGADAKARGSGTEVEMEEEGRQAPAEEVEPQELLPPPPAGPPLPPLLRGRDMASQRQLLKDAFLLADQYMSMEEGCTATLVMLDKDLAQGGWTLQSANVGDSTALLVNFSRGSWCKLSEDHRIASSSSERERLARMGHTVRTRLYGLNISRMLGDRFLKEEDLGFLAEPYVGMTAQVGPNDHAVLVVASDGLWDVLSEERAANLLLQEAAKPVSVARLPIGGRPPAASSASGPAPPPAGVAAAGAPLPPSALLGCQAVADLLLTKALALRSKDDITIAVLELGPHLWTPLPSQVQP